MAGLNSSSGFLSSWKDGEIFAHTSSVNLSTIANSTTDLNFSTAIINDGSSSNNNNASTSFEEEIFGLFYDDLNVTVSGLMDNMTNATGNGTLSAPICVMCRYYLQPWLKALRVGFGVCIVLANIVTFVMLLRARSLQLALRYFLLNVAVVDCGYGAGFLYHSAIVDFPQFIVMNFECKLRYGGLCMVSMVALFTLMAMCIERVIALKFAFTYHLLITKTNLMIGIVIFWAVPAAIVTPTYLLMDSSVGECNFVRFIKAESFVVFSVTYFILMVVAVFCQLVLLYIARTHIKKILPTIVGDQKKKAAFKMNLKATSTTLSLAVPFVICATPKILTYMFLAFNPGERIKVESLTLLAVTIYLNVSNSLINPIVYCYRLPELRTQIMAVFGRRMTSSTWSSDEPIKPHPSSSMTSKPSGNKDWDDTEDNSEHKGSHVEAQGVVWRHGDVDKGIERQDQGIRAVVRESFDTSTSSFSSHVAKDDNLSDKVEKNRKRAKKRIQPSKSDDQDNSRSHEESPAGKSTENDRVLLHNDKEFRCSSENGICMDEALSLQRRGGLQGDKGRLPQDQTDAGKYKWLVDPDAPDRKTNRRRSDCAAQKNLKFKSCPRFRKGEEICFPTKSNLEECGKKFQSTPNFDENGKKFESGLSFPYFQTKSETKCDYKVTRDNNSESRQEFLTCDKTQNKLGFPEMDKRSNPKISTSHDREDAGFQEDRKVPEIRQQIGHVESPRKESQKSFSFKHIWKTWAASILAEAAKKLVYEAVGQHPRSKYSTSGETICPWRFASGSAILPPPSVLVDSIPETRSTESDAHVADAKTSEGGRNVLIEAREIRAENSSHQERKGGNQLRENNSAKLMLVSGKEEQLKGTVNGDEERIETGGIKVEEDSDLDNYLGKENEITPSVVGNFGLTLTTSGMN